MYNLNEINFFTECLDKDGLVHAKNIFRKFGFIPHRLKESKGQYPFDRIVHDGSFRYRMPSWTDCVRTGVWERKNRLFRLRNNGEVIKNVVDISCPKWDFDRWANSAEVRDMPLLVFIDFLEEGWSVKKMIEFWGGANEKASSRSNL